MIVVMMVLHHVVVIVQIRIIIVNKITVLMIAVLCSLRVRHLVERRGSAVVAATTATLTVRTSGAIIRL